MIIFESHVPNFVSMDPAIPRQEFNCLNEILSNEWVSSWKEMGDPGSFKFCWEPLERSDTFKCVLMGEWTKLGKKHSWVIGYMSEIPELAQWNH